MSPYLFVLAMEVLQLLLLQRVDQSDYFQFHWNCKKVNLLSLYFADDLILFCKADERSVMLFCESLETFAQWSGLEANVNKSQLIVSKAALDIKPRLLTVLGFQEGVLPMRYLGLPLISSRLKAADCSPLLAKVDERLHGWGRLQLSFAARVQLIRSVLSALNVYWAMAFILPKGIIKSIEARMRKFLWQGGTTTGMAKVAWRDVYRPLEEGGQGIWALETLNRGLMCRHLWDVVQKNDSFIWVSWIISYRLKEGTIWTINPHSGSWCWRKILCLRIPLLNNLRLDTQLDEVIHDGEWDWPDILDIEHREITDTLPLLGYTNSIRWINSIGFTSAEAYRLFHPPGPKTNRGGKDPIGHVFFAHTVKSSPMTTCPFGVNFRECLRVLRLEVKFTLPFKTWRPNVEWASRRSRGRHPMNAACRGPVVVGEDDTAI
ncbi:UNVERIFIED_CONTAM: putative ribonuclease H protein [Sesamum latifolium]|uniref:Ribonuclease H protein n=1 Tax=Sesamum latifolium TaxID=2727402 RepID=A0AAW2WXK4_9LAMI